MTISDFRKTNIKYGKWYKRWRKCGRPYLIESLSYKRGASCNQSALQISILCENLGFLWFLIVETRRIEWSVVKMYLWRKICCAKTFHKSAKSYLTKFLFISNGEFHFYYWSETVFRIWKSRFFSTFQFFWCIYLIDSW